MIKVFLFKREDPKKCITVERNCPPTQANASWTGTQYGKSRANRKQRSMGWESGQTGGEEGAPITHHPTSMPPQPLDHPWDRT